MASARGDELEAVWADLQGALSVVLHSDATVGVPLELLAWVGAVKRIPRPTARVRGLGDAGDGDANNVTLPSRDAAEFLWAGPDAVWTRVVTLPQTG